MKGGVAAMIDAARVAAQTRLLRRPADRRSGRRRGIRQPRRRRAGRRAWAADMAVVTEPTDLRIGVGHKGFAWIDVETRGRAAHGSRPPTGGMRSCGWAACWHASRRSIATLQARPPHPLMGTGSLHASIIAGGRELSSYPDRCDAADRTADHRRARPADAPARRVERDSRRASRRGSRVRGRGAPDVLRGLPMKLPPGHPLPRGAGAARVDVGVGTSRDGRHELLDRRRHARPRRHPDGAVRARRRGTAQHGRIRERRRRVACRDALAALALALP